jgi:hypothetical protein
MSRCALCVLAVAFCIVATFSMMFLAGWYAHDGSTVLAVVNGFFGLVFLFAIVGAIFFVLD